MVDAIPPSSSRGTYPSATPSDQTKWTELQWEITALGAFQKAVGIGGTSDFLYHQILVDFQNKQNPDQIAALISQYIGDVNEDSTHIALPPFQFQSDPTQAVLGYTTFFERFLYGAAANQLIPWDSEEEIATQLTTLYSELNGGGITYQQAYNSLQSLISTANSQLLPLNIQFPSIPSIFQK